MQNANFLRVLRQANRSRQRTMIPSASDREILALCDVVTCSDLTSRSLSFPTLATCYETIDQSEDFNCKKKRDTAN